MYTSDRSTQKKFNDLVEDVKARDLPEAEKAALAFYQVAQFFIETSEREIELLKAMGDSQTLIKEQIKLETIKFTRSLFADCFRATLERKAWDE